MQEWAWVDAMGMMQKLVNQMEADWTLIKRLPAHHLTKELALASLASSTHPLRFNLIPERLIDDDFLLEAVRINHQVLSHIPDLYRKHDVIEAALAGVQEGLRFVPAAVIDDGVARMALLHCGLNIKHIPRQMITSEMCELAVTTSPCAFRYVPSRHKNELISMLAVSEDGLMLAHVPDNLINNELILAALHQNGMAVKHISEEKQTGEMLEIAISKDPEAIRYASRRVRNDVLWESVVSSDGRLLMLCPDKEQTRKIAHCAVNNHAQAIKYVADELVDNDLLRLAVRMDASTLKLIPKEHQSRELLIDLLLDNLDNLTHMDHLNLLLKVDLVQWMNSPSFRLEKRHMADKLDILAERMAPFKDIQEDVLHLDAARNADARDINKILHLAHIKPMNYTKMGRLCVPLGERKLLVDLFGAEMASRIFKTHLSPKKKNRHSIFPKAYGISREFH